MKPAPHNLISIDIGSTYTKGALFAFGGPAGARVLKRCEVPTTPHLTDGFNRVLAGLVPRGGGAVDKVDTVDRVDGNPRAATPAASTLSTPSTVSTVPVRFSSSAKGGLRIAAVGLVPELTVKIAKLAACSAGGKVVRAFAYGLTSESVAELEALAPDIVLVTGGTDGGNRERVLENVRLLAASRLACTIVYAGNSELACEVRKLLAGKKLRVTDNVMPEVDRMNLEPARAEIRHAFLETIVEGKGLAEVVRAVGAPPKPTPLAMFELAEALAARRPRWRDFMVVDMGGATTDVYSHTEAFMGGDGAVLRGVHEPLLKRSVEGDLGLRVSALPLYEAVKDSVHSPELEAFVRKVAAAPDYLPQAPEELEYDRVLARACVKEAVLRHAGILRSVWTPTGRVSVQHGKDLRRVRTMVGTGGSLARLRDPQLWSGMWAKPDGEELNLLPEQFEYKVDAEYLWPLLGNLAAEFPEEAAALAENCLQPLSGGVILTPPETPGGCQRRV